MHELVFIKIRGIFRYYKCVPIFIKHLPTPQKCNCNLSLKEIDFLIVLIIIFNKKSH